MIRSHVSIVMTPHRGESETIIRFKRINFEGGTYEARIGYSLPEIRRVRAEWFLETGHLL